MVTINSVEFSMLRNTNVQTRHTVRCARESLTLEADVAGTYSLSVTMVSDTSTSRAVLAGWGSSGADKCPEGDASAR